MASGSRSGEAGTEGGQKLEQNVGRSCFSLPNSGPTILTFMLFMLLTFLVVVICLRRGNNVNFLLRLADSREVEAASPH